MPKFKQACFAFLLFFTIQHAFISADLIPVDITKTSPPFRDFLYEYYGSDQKKRGYSKLLYATELDYRDLLIYLLNGGESPNTLTLNKDDSCLFMAVAKYDVDLVNLFLEKGADPKIMLNRRMTLLNHTLLYGGVASDELLKLFLDHGVLPDSFGLCDPHKPLVTAAQLGRKTAFFNLIEYGAVVANTSNSGKISEKLLTECCKRIENEPEEDRLEIIEYLVNLGANFQYRTHITHFSPVHLAAKSGFKDIFRYFIERGANLKDVQQIDNKGIYKQTLLGSAIDGNNFEEERISIIKFLKEKKVDLNQKTYIRFDKSSQGMCPPLIKAIYENKMAICQCLLEEGVGLNFFCESEKFNGYTPLMMAIELENIPLIEDLLQRGAAPENTGKAGFSPLDLAASKGNDKIVDILINAILERYILRNKYVP